MKTAHSDDNLELILSFIRKWNEKIDTHDDRDTRQIIKAKMLNAWQSVEELLVDWDKKILSQYANDERKAIEKMLENQKTEKYKKLKKVADDIISVHYQIEHLYELKNRKSSELIKLRAECAKMRLGEI